ncbi:uracil catabolism 4 [Fusarium phyllophilum]|uniref:Uracil catabolism 4 n=1 Tax=Fusarium phyllophilum TaxID=47803 RepID=A0A8H5JUI3_9HYPO|nr:uracil catabolism 4 [Fusarium phyllophilum]
MTPPLPNSIPDGIDHFGSLPLELNVQIMELLTLTELCSLTRASPAAWRSFRRDHPFLLKSYVIRFYDHYGDPAAISLLRLLCRLRLFRGKMKGKSRAEVERQLQPVFDSILFLKFMDKPSEWQANLPVLIAVEDLIAELRSVYDIWKDSMCLVPNTELIHATRWEAWRFAESFLRYECLCSLLYHADGFTYKYMVQFRDIFLQPLVIGEETIVPSDLRPWGVQERIVNATGVRWKDRRPYPPIEFTFDAPKHFRKWFESIIMGVDRSLRTRWGRATKDRKKLGLSMEESEIVQFLQRKRSEDKHLCYHLALQGNTLLNHLLALTPQALNDYIVKTYTSTMDCRADNEPKYHPDLEDMEFIEDNWRCD